MRVYLTGYMCSGKSKIGLYLAQAIGLDFMDMDNAIEQISGQTIAQLFNQGEKVFRAVERIALLNTLDLENIVIATGGGAPCFYDNMELMNSAGATIYLKVRPSLLAKRLRAGRGQRPLALFVTDAELYTFVKQSLERRLPYYFQANFVVNNNRNMEDTVRNIAGFLVQASTFLKSDVLP